MSASTRNPEALDPLITKTVLVAMLGPLMTNLDSTVVNVSLSTLTSEMHSTLATMQWLVSGYLLALALMLPLSGWLVDRVGAKRVYIGCFTGFTAASVLCGLAQGSAALIFFRVVQGMAGGILVPMAQMMIAKVAGRHMVRVMGVSSIPILLAPILGPVIAGAILVHASWRWLFFINLPIGILAIALAVLMLPQDDAERRPRRFDARGFLLLSPGLALLLFGFKERGDLGPYGLALGAGLLALFFFHARREGKEAIIDIQLLAGPVFNAAAITQFLSNGMMFAGQMLIPLYLMMACHLNSTQTGWMVAMMGVGMMVSFVRLGGITDRFGCRPVAAFGAALALASTLPFVWMSQGPLVPWFAYGLLFLRGVGSSMVMIPSMSAAYASVPKADLPVATTTVNIVQRLGGPVATTLVAVCMDSYGSAETAFGLNKYGIAFLLLAGIHGLDLLSSLRLPYHLQHLDRAEAPLEAAEALGD